MFFCTQCSWGPGCLYWLLLRWYGITKRNVLLLYVLISKFDLWSFCLIQSFVDTSTFTDCHVSKLVFSKCQQALKKLNSVCFNNQSVLVLLDKLCFSDTFYTLQLHSSTTSTMMSVVIVQIRFASITTYSLSHSVSSVHWQWACNAHAQPIRSFSSITSHRSQRDSKPQNQYMPTFSKSVK